MVQKALSGLKVLEYSQLVSGPYCSRLLADLGAEVIKIEKPGTGDEARRRKPFLNQISHPEKSGLFFYLNTNKQGITLDPHSPVGRRLFLDLVDQVDVLIEDKAPKVMKEMGLDYSSLAKRNPRLVVTSITPFGQYGPYSGYKSHGINSYGVSGLAKILWDTMPEEVAMPLKGWGYLGEYDCGLSAALATLGALYARLRTDKGQHVDISKQESLIAMERVEISRQGNENDPGRTSTVSLNQMIGGLHKCKDGYIMIVVPLEHQWQALVELMGSPEWAKDEKCNDEFSRDMYHEEINAHIGEWMMNYTKEEFYHQAQALNCPVGYVATVEDMLKSRQHQARGFFQEVDHPEIGKVNIPTVPYLFSRTPRCFERPAPLLGEHNKPVFTEWLGLGSNDLDELKALGII
jgi:crotonobetainyl-CoA:carnitine CoA-transferase CaiB-like acyl-CoA transferase